MLWRQVSWTSQLLILSGCQKNGNCGVVQGLCARHTDDICLHQNPIKSDQKPFKPIKTCEWILWRAFRHSDFWGCSECLQWALWVREIRMIIFSQLSDEEDDNKSAKDSGIFPVINFLTCKCNVHSYLINLSDQLYENPAFGRRNIALDFVFSCTNRVS